MEWVRRWLRRNTRPVPRHKARMYHNRLSVAYYMLAWTVGGLTVYSMIGVSSPLPTDLDVYADEKNRSSIYKIVERIRLPSDGMKVKIVNMQNFSIKSTEDYTPKTIQQQVEESQLKAKEDFFGNTEGCPDEELDLSL